MITGHEVIMDEDANYITKLARNGHGDGEIRLLASVLNEDPTVCTEPKIEFIEQGYDGRRPVGVNVSNRRGDGYFKSVGGV